VDTFKEGLLALPTEPRLHFNLGVAHGILGDWSQAITHYQASLSQDRTVAVVHRQLAFALRMVRDTKGSIEHFRMAHELDPLNPDASCNLAAALWDIQDIPGTMKYYAEALTVDPNHVDALTKVNQLQKMGMVLPADLAKAITVESKVPMTEIQHHPGCLSMFGCGGRA